MNEFMGYVGALLSLLIGLGVLADRVRPKTPCAIGDQRWTTQQQKNGDIEKRLETGTRAFDHVRDEIRDGLDDLGKEMRDAMNELAKELRAEIRIVEAKSTAGDKGLQELSKDLVNAVAQMKDMTKAIVEAKG